MGAKAPAGKGKAYFELFEGTGSKGGGGAKGKETIPFQFNPKELQIVKKAKWESKPTKNNKAPPPEYTGPEAASMSLEMFLDAYDNTIDNKECDVAGQVEKLINACTPTDASASGESGKTPQPPGVIFSWGGKVYFRGYIESVTAKYTRFTQEGKPIRAVCTVALKEFPKDKPKQNPTSGSLAALRSRQVIVGDTLAGIAYREYGDPNLWRAIADVNSIDDPMLLPPGMRLLIPAASDAVHHHSTD
jgi:nucleoid-associated protein YgaU